MMTMTMTTMKNKRVIFSVQYFLCDIPHLRPFRYHQHYNDINNNNKAAAAAAAITRSCVFRSRFDNYIDLSRQLLEGTFAGLYLSIYTYPAPPLE